MTLSLELLVATGIGWVTACGILLLLRGRSFPVVLGLSLIGYAVNVFIFAMGRIWTGLLWFLTGGLLTLGWAWDFWHMNEIVSEENRKG